MDVIIVTNFCGDLSKSDNDRFFYLAKLLYNITQIELITSTFWHEGKLQRDTNKIDVPFKITLIKEPGYPKNVCLKRFQSHLVWGKNVLNYLKKRKKPDVVYCAVPSLTGPNLIAKYCEKNNIRFVIDVQDLWPEAFQMVVNVPVVSSMAFFSFKVLVDGIYKRADAICAVSDTYCQRALKVNKKVSSATTVFLGTELATFDRYAGEKSSIVKKEGELWLAYCGTLGSSYDLTCVIDALRIVKEKGTVTPRLIVMGDGPYFQRLKDHAEEKNVNVVFMGRLSYDKMCALLKKCDVTVNPITKGAAQSIINKHADYAAAGLPVLNTQECCEYRELVDKYKMGINCRNNDSEDLADKIILLLQNESLRKEMGANARRCAEELFDRQKTYKLLLDQITGG